MAQAAIRHPGRGSRPLVGPSASRGPDAQRVAARRGPGAPRASARLSGASSRSSASMTLEDLEAFFRACDAIERGPEREPDWEEHLAVIRTRRSMRGASRRRDLRRRERLHVRGRWSPHPAARNRARGAFCSRESRREGSQSSPPPSEVLQELLHFYLPARSISRLFDAAMVRSCQRKRISRSGRSNARMSNSPVSWPATYPRLQARDLCHLASCRRRGVRELKTFDRALDAAAPGLIAGN